MFLYYHLSPGAAVTLSQATFAWSKEDLPVLKDVNLNVKTGSLVAVVGSVGSGKSSLLSAVLGALEKMSGSVDVQVSGRTISAFCGTLGVRNHHDILGRRPVIGTCFGIVPGNISALHLPCPPPPQTTPFPEKNKKENKFIGGQKLRISLARAVFHDADVYLLDDPFSAVDIHVASHLFDHVVGPSGILKSKVIRSNIFPLA
ncbi:multidrug resistance protein, putative [Ixodes scapularis]|uniref:Multidrug resistance protein, putative n=1 Tax=Ixodes scapularis TaxID=6945 RepID=B7Q4D6_IXOSC|nr:multidrug resistance protein, putative [Ixodes scapularis]|eukprot:XP_002411521.1 multidrug resistance protein, putative [Ixodes scapularis]